MEKVQQELQEKILETQEDILKMMEMMMRLTKEKGAIETSSLMVEHILLGNTSYDPSYPSSFTLP